MLKSQERSHDILVDFGTMLFEKLDSINANLERLAITIENFGVANEQAPDEN